MKTQYPILVFSTQMMQTGGIESHLSEFCKQMAANNVKIDLVVLNSCMLPENEAFLKSICNRTYFGKTKSFFRKFLWLLKVGVRLRLKKYAAVYTNGQGDSIGIFRKFIKVQGPWIHHHHTSGDKNDQEAWSAGYIETLKAADTVIACSGSNARDMEEVLLRPIDTIPCFSRKISVGKTPGIKAGKVKFGYYGRLIPEKGVDLLCRMSEDDNLKNIEFHIWGEGKAYPPSFFEKYNNIKYNGTFSGVNGLAGAIASLDAFLLLSVHAEGLPISLLEAMSAGLPWLATKRGGIPDIACDPVSTRLIPVDADYEQTKHAVERFANDILHGKVSRTLQEKLYNEKFSAPVLVRKWLAAFQLN